MPGAFDRRAVNNSTATVNPSMILNTAEKAYVYNNSSPKCIGLKSEKGYNTLASAGNAPSAPHIRHLCHTLGISSDEAILRYYNHRKEDRPIENKTRREPLSKRN